MRHDAAAVWVHIVPLLLEIEKLAPQVNTLHIVSDSPSAQYRNKKIFYIISQLKSYCTSLSSIFWHYCECGHGKGAPDGVGGVIKRMADKFVAYGNDIITIESLIEHLQSSVKAIKIFRVEYYEITEKDWLIPNTLVSFPGTMRVHQAVWTDSWPLTIALRTLSCVELQCQNNSLECPHGKHLDFYNLFNGNIDHNVSIPQLTFPLSPARVQVKAVNIIAQKITTSNSSLFPRHGVINPTIGTQKCHVKRFKASENLALNFYKKVKPNEVTNNSQDYSNLEILSQYDIDVESDAIPSCSYFDNISPSTFKNFEQPKKQLESCESENRNDDSDTDLEIF